MCSWTLRPGRDPDQWQGRWRTSEQSWQFSPLSRTTTVWNQLNFRGCWPTRSDRAVRTDRRRASSISSRTASRFRFPGRNLFFFILLGTIILPNQVTLLPTYVIFTWLGWNGTWLPLIVPHFFANAFNVFLLRQYFMTIPREMDESAMIDGAGPFRILRSVIIPQSIPAITAVILFHFFWAGTTSSSPPARPASPSCSRCRRDQQYNALYARQ
jgi:multiple sugar transport system permease protein